MVKLNLITNNAGGDNINLIMRGKRIKRLVFKAEPYISIEQLRIEMEKQRIELLNHGKRYNIEIATCFKSIGWRAGNITEIDKPVDIYKPTMDYDDTKVSNVDERIDYVVVYLIPEAPNAGGCDPKYITTKNDCLHVCLVKAFGWKENLPEKIRQPRQLKKLLNVEREDPVPIDRIEKLENILNATIKVTGDFMFASGAKHPLEINLRLLNGHYTIEEPERTRIAEKLFYPRRQKNLRTYYKDKDGVHVYDGKSISLINKDTFNTMNNYHSKYLMIEVANHTDAELEQKREKYIKDAKTILELSNGKINMYQYKNAQNCALDTWLQTTKALKQPEPIGELEGTVLQKSMLGGCLYAKKGYKGFAVSYDCNSRYSAILASQYFYVVMGEGKPMQLSTDEFSQRVHGGPEGKFNYGLYHCIITGSHNLFMKNTDNWYTHFDLRCALELGLTMEIIQNDQFNFYSYDGVEKIQAKKIFGKWVNDMYELKQKGAPVKPHLSSLWGKLCEKVVHRVRVNNGETYEIPDTKKPILMRPANNGGMNIYIRDVGKVFKTDFARIGTFLTSYARMSFVRMIKPYENHIVRVHTDSVTLNKDIDVKFAVSDKLGDFKVEGKGECEIANVVNIKYSEK